MEENGKEKRSIIRHRGVLFRTLAYCLPWKRAIIGAVAISLVSSLLGAVSLLAMIPVLQLVMDRSVVVRAEEQGWEITREARERRALIGDTLDEAGREGLEEMGVRSYPLARLDAYLDEKKATAKATIYGFLDEREFDAVLIIAGVLLIATLLKATLDYQSKYLMTKVLFRALQQVKIDLYSSVLFLDLASFQERSTGNLLARLSGDVTKMSTILKSILSQSFTTPFTVVALFIVLMVISPRVTLVTMAALPIIALPIVLITRLVRKLARKDAEEDAYLVDVMQGTLQGLLIVRAFGAEDREHTRFRKVAREQVRRQIGRMRVAIAGPAIMEVLTMAAICAVLVAGAYLVIKSGRMDPAEFVVYLIALQRFYKPIKATSGALMRVQRGLASADRVFEIMDEPPRIVQKPDAVDIPPIERSIHFDKVSFHYDDDRDIVLRDFDLEVPRGATVALVGETGSGKSTIAKLLPRFFDPTGGAIRIDGVDLRDATIESIRRQIAFVTQETILFDATIAENIAYGRDDAAAEDIIASARLANIDGFIRSLPQGYDTRIGEAGNQLSGGQRQRLAIARALLRDAPILILDEATSALDNETEASIQRELERLARDRTVLVIAHRLSTIRNADCIVVLHKGEVAEKGTHSELMALGGRYAAMQAAENADERRAAAEPPPAAVPPPVGEPVLEPAIVHPGPEG